VHHLTKNGLGQSTCNPIGGDPIIGMAIIDILKLIREHRDDALRVPHGLQEALYVRR